VSLVLVFLLIVVDGVLPLVPGEGTLLAASAPALTAGWPAVLGLALVAAVAAFLGDALAYLLGRTTGTTRFRWQRHPRVARLLDRTGATLDRRGAALVVSARFLPGWRVAVTFLAGATRLAPHRFLAASALGSVAWACYLLTVGTTVGALTGAGPLVVALVSLTVMTVLGQAVRWVRGRAARRDGRRREGCGGQEGRQVAATSRVTSAGSVAGRSADPVPGARAGASAGRTPTTWYGRPASSVHRSA